MTLKQIKAHEEKCKRVAVWNLEKRKIEPIIFKIKGFRK